MQLRRTARAIVEAALILPGALVMVTLPRPVILYLSRVAGALVYRFAHGLRRVGEANLNLVFGDTVSRAQREAWLRESFQTFARTMLDLVWFRLRTRSRLRRWVETDDSLDVLDRGPVIIVTAHFGNWELISLLSGLRGHRCLSVAASTFNPVINYVLRKLRMGSGSDTVPRRGALRALIRRVREGGNIGMVADQNVLPRDGGIFQPIFGVPALVTKAPATLSTRCNLAVVPVFCRPLPDGRYCMYASDPVLPGSDQDAMTRKIGLLLEREIRHYPGFWLWSYKRWHYRLPDHDAGCFPFYTRELQPNQMAGAGNTVHPGRATG
ncbi:MAG: hypothetical protein A2498_05895 [Lentisphaerae bacterium RIFOXYC12_FULL_60_16]|nr:MAG: hypothetical protein A2498_05895 [Lentisphaerae bacterium RIFOXYC12_FULL_60_16]